MPPIEFLAERADRGKTIATVLRARFKLPWSQVKRLIENGHVRVAGFACTDPAQRVKYRNRVWVREGVVANPPGSADEKKKRIEEERRRQANAKARRDPKGAGKPAAAKTDPNKAGKPPRPEPAGPLPLAAADVLYADDAVVVVNKPAGLTTMRHAEEVAEFGPRGKRFLPKTAADLLPGLLGTPDRRVIAVHRIDRDTSGVVVFARTPPAAESLTRQFRKHTADRRYLALTRGVPKEGRIESTLVPDRGDGRRGTGTGPDGKRAVTFVKVLERFDGYALVECRLETGRTHQVRIHLGEAGAPLCGERVYDRPVNGKPAADGSGADRPMLHAARLGFDHPETGRPERWETPPPADFQKLLEKLRGQG